MNPKPRYGNLTFARPFVISLLLLLLLPAVTGAAEPGKEKGEFFGAKDTEYPAWFKQSFLNLKEDIEEAGAEGKRLMMFFYQNGCPYCNAMVERNLAQKDILEKVQKHFDVIAINMWGDREVTDVDGKTYTEKTFSEHLKIQFTPTLLMWDEKGKIVLRLNGYRAPDRFIHDVNYVADKQENAVSYRDYIKANYIPKQSSKKMHAEDFFADKHDLKAIVGKGKPIAVFFEQKDCPNCDTLHSKVLPDSNIRKVLKDYHAIQLDMWSKTPVVTPTGKQTTARQWAQELDVKFAPSILVFNTQGEEIIRSEAFFKVFHTWGILNYVLDGGYKKQPSFQRYLSDQAEHLQEQGKSVDIWNYSDEKPGSR